jgi:phage/plasmid-associated DNA primase
VQEIDWQEAVRFLKLLNKQAGRVRLRAFYHATNPLKAGDPGRKSGADRPLLQQWQHEGRGIYVVINDGGDRDTEITDCWAYFCEWDDRPKEQQVEEWKNLGLPEPTIQVDSGGKSVHNYWILNEPVPPIRWKLIQTRLLDHANADRTLKNPSRVMRLPGTYHVDGTGALGAKCSILNESGFKYSSEDIEKCLPAEEYYEHSRKAERYEETEQHDESEIQAALNCIPAAVPGQGQYAFYRNLLWSLIKVCGNAETAGQLMRRHSPEFREIDFLLRNGGEQISEGTFWYWAKKHGFTRERKGPTRVVRRVEAPVVAADAAVSNHQIYDKSSTEFIELCEQHVFRRISEHWICVDGVLHHWNGIYFAATTDESLAPIVGAFLGQLCHISSKTEEVSFPWRRPKYVDEVISWVKKTCTPVEVNPRNAINCANGVVRWEWEGTRLNVSLMPHDPGQGMTYVTEYNYDPEADSSYLWALLEAVTPEDRDTMQRILGSALDLPKYRAVRGRPRAVLMIGGGSNGKDAIRGALRDTLGGRNLSGCSLNDFRQYDTGRKFGIAALRGSAVNWCSENSEFIKIDGLQSLKAAISGDELSFELKGVQEQQFVPSALFVFNLNKDPSLSGDQYAIGSRFHAFRFNRRFVSEVKAPGDVKADPRFKDDPDFIARYICPAFLNWLLEGLSIAVGDGIDYSTGKAAMDELRRGSSHLFDFCDAKGLHWVGGESFVYASDVWSLLDKWYEDEGYRDRHGRWIEERSDDRAVKAARLMPDRLKVVFPEMSRMLDPENRRARLMGLAWQGFA